MSPWLLAPTVLFGPGGDGTVAWATSICAIGPGGPAATCGGAPCDQHVEGSLGDLLAAAAAVPDLATGERPAVRLCSETGLPRQESLAIDNSDNRLGRPLGLFIADPLCPPVGGQSGEPVLLWTLAGDMSAPPDEGRVNIDARAGGPCATTGSAGLRIGGLGRLSLTGATIRGTTETAIEFDSAGELRLVGSRLLDLRGGAVRTHGWTFIHNVVFDGNFLGPGAPAALVLGEGHEAAVIVEGAAFVRNGVDSSDGVERTILGPGLERLRRSLFFGNALGAGSSLVSATWRPPAAIAMDGDVPQSELLLSHNEFSNNGHWVFVVPEDIPEGEFRSLGGPGPRCSAEDPTLPWTFEESIELARPEGQSALIRIGEGGSTDVGRQAVLSKTFFVGNRTGGAPLVELWSSAGGVEFQASQNTLFDNGGAAFVDASACQGGMSLAVFRNLLGDEPDGLRPTVGLPTQLLSVIDTMNVSLGGGPWASGGSAALYSVLGPHPNIDAVEFLEPSTVRGLAACERYLLLCPARTEADCSAEQASFLPCPYTSAARAIPADSWVEELGTPWPWETDFPWRDGGGAAPGATGGTCLPDFRSYDFVRVDGQPEWGDGDYAGDVIDCDNFDGSRRPSLPSPAGYASDFCCEDPLDCYRCPEDSSVIESANEENPWPGENGGADDRPRSDADEAEQGTPASACTNQGCGYSWSALPLLVLGAIAARTRRRLQV